MTVDEDAGGGNFFLIVRIHCYFLIIKKTRFELLTIAGGLPWGPLSPIHFKFAMECLKGFWSRTFTHTHRKKPRRFNFFFSNDSSEEPCPICLDPCPLVGQEICMNGHRMHVLCAFKMQVHMRLWCPLCRAMMKCIHCNSTKTKVWCPCFFEPAEPENIWAKMKPTFKAHIWLKLATMCLPLTGQSAILLLLILTVSFSVMVHYTVKIQRGYSHITFGGAVMYWGQILAQVGFEMFVLLSLLSLLVTIYWISFAPDGGDRTENVPSKVEFYLKQTVPGTKDLAPVNYP